jgi:hypothetical protein
MMCLTERGIVHAQSRHRSPRYIISENILFENEWWRFACEDRISGVGLESEHLLRDCVDRIVWFLHSQWLQQQLWNKPVSPLDRWCVPLSLWRKRSEQAIRRGWPRALSRGFVRFDNIKHIVRKRFGSRACLAWLHSSYCVFPPFTIYGCNSNSEIHQSGPLQEIDGVFHFPSGGGGEVNKPRSTIPKAPSVLLWLIRLISSN